MTWRKMIALLMILLSIGLSSCGNDREVPIVLLADELTDSVSNPLAGAIAETSPPERIQQLKPYLDVYEPQVRIATPQNNQTIDSTTVEINLQVRNLPIYKDQLLGLGPHLHLFLDNQPHQAVYDADAPIVLENLAPGTHILRLLAVRPWGESFKNEGAYDQITFDVFVDSPENSPDDSQPLLTYNQPQAAYGAEPILLDFYLSNAPLHLVAQADETISDWRLRCTINGEAFVFDRWQPIYLQGFRPGKNWLKLELIDENGNLIDGALNTSVRVIDYQPGGNDGLSRLVRSEIPLEQAKVLVDPDYEPPTLTIEEPAEVQTELTEKAENTASKDADSLPLPPASAAPATATPSTASEKVSDQASTTEPASATKDEEAQAKSASDQQSDVSGKMPEMGSAEAETSSPTSSSNLSTPEMSEADMLLDAVQGKSATEATKADEKTDDQAIPGDSVESALDNVTIAPDEDATNIPNSSDSPPAAALDDAAGRPVDQLTEDLPSDETTDTAPADKTILGGPTQSKTLEPESEENDTEAVDEDVIEVPNDVNEPEGDSIPKTNLKTLEDNADVI
ncbi:MAG: hypothetical protein ACFB0E_02535 [Leptolyngbyaceae cyanobacterium]